jgi:hypothetical protein
MSERINNLVNFYMNGILCRDVCPSELRKTIKLGEPLEFEE